MKCVRTRETQAALNGLEFCKINVMLECGAKNNMGSLTWELVRGLKITSSGELNSLSN